MNCFNLVRALTIRKAPVDAVETFTDITLIYVPFYHVYCHLHFTITSQHFLSPNK